MVPEIALTPQTARRFEERFGERVAILHSKLGLGERYDEWRRLRDGAGADLRRAAVGGVRAARRPGADRRRRGARLRLQAGERSPLRRARGGRAAGAQCRARCSCAAARRRAPESWQRMRTLSLPARVDNLELPPVELLDMRGLRHALHPGRAARARGRAHPRAQGDRAREPPRLVGVRGMPRLRAHVDVPALRRDAHAAPRGDRPRGSRAITAGTSSRAAQSCPDCGSTAVSRHGAGTQRVEAELREALAPLPVFRLDADAARRKHGIAETLAALRRGRRGRAGRHADGRAGPRLPRGRAGGRAGRGRDAALPRLPRGGAHVRARVAARRAQRPRPGRRARAGPDHEPRHAPACGMRRATTPRASWPRRWSAAARCATRPSPR